jgi:hypothetical protein
MIKGKSAQHVILNSNQIETLIYSSVRNTEDVIIESGEKIYNNFIITLILGIVFEEAFPEYNLKDIDANDYSVSDFYTSHMVDSLAPFGVDIFRLDNKETKEKLWGLTLAVNQKNIGDFVQALAEIDSFWNELDQEEGIQNEPSKDAVLIAGNDTVN